MTDSERIRIVEQLWALEKALRGALDATAALRRIAETMTKGDD